MVAGGKKEENITLYAGTSVKHTLAAVDAGWGGTTAILKILSWA
jgi:hypothetical protein